MAGRARWQALGKAARAAPDSRAAAARDWLADLLGRADFEPPHALFARVLARPCPADPVSARRAILGRLGDEAADPIDEFLAQALAHDRGRPPSLGGFLRALASTDTEIKRDLEHGGHAVRIMTVHGSKGLQSPVVILPDTLGVPPAGDTRVYFDGPGDDALLLWPPRAADREPVTQALHDARRAAETREYRRLLYVAMTRAEDRLIVCGWNTRRTAAPDCWYHLIRDGLTDLAVAERDDELARLGLVEGDGMVLRHRSAQTRPPVPDAPEATPAPQAPPPAWLWTPPSPEPRPTHPLAPSQSPDDPPAASPVADDAAAARFQRGRLIHRLLQDLPACPTETRAAAARAWLSRPLHGLDAAQVEALTAETLGVLDDPALAPVFGPGSRAEVPVVGLVGDDVVSGQVDRLLVTPDRVLVVDFKTNRPPPRDPADVTPGYLRQMALYRAVLAQVYPQRAIACALVWTVGPRLMALDATALDAALPG